MAHVIAIDGPSGVGKSSVAKALAARLHWTYLDTGAMYRTVTLAWLNSGRGEDALQDHDWLTRINMDFDEKQILLDGELVNQEIRSRKVTAKVSLVAATPEVRAFLTEMQRAIAGRRNCILDGRDIGTVVFPDAFLKIYLTAGEEVRARRRWRQMGGEESEMTLEEVLADQARRDREDSNRDVAPLKKADDALELDTDHRDQDAVVDALFKMVAQRLAATSS